jgi:hypothetical protein
MARHQVAAGGGDLQIWRVAANILNKQSRTAENWVVLQLGGWAWGQQLLTLYNKLVAKCQKGPRTWTDSLDKRPKLNSCLAARLSASQEGLIAMESVTSSRALLKDVTVVSSVAGSTRCRVLCHYWDNNRPACFFSRSTAPAMLPTAHSGTKLYEAFIWALPLNASDKVPR